MKLYKEIMMDHYQNPRNRGRIDNPDFATAQYNPSCGDSVSFDGIIEDGVLKGLSFEGKGCVISQATASIFTEYFVGKKIEDILNVGEEEVLEIIGIQLGPTRTKCAFLSLIALKDGILEYNKNKK